MSSFHTNSGQYSAFVSHLTNNTGVIFLLILSKESRFYTLQVLFHLLYPSFSVKFSKCGSKIRWQLYNVVINFSAFWWRCSFCVFKTRRLFEQEWLCYWNETGNWTWMANEWETSHLSRNGENQRTHVIVVVSIPNKLRAIYLVYTRQIINTTPVSSL